VVSGEDRFQVRRIVPSEKAYLIGEIDDLADLPDVQVPRPDELTALRTLGVRYAEALATLNDVERDPEFSDEPGMMTFQIASLLEWELPVKQHFLAIRSATERVARLLHALPSLLGSLEARAQVHRRASLNGKGGSPPPMTDALS